MVLVPEPPSAVQVKVPASSGDRLLVVTFCANPFNGKHVVHPDRAFHVKVVEAVGKGSVVHVRVTLLNMG